MLLTNSSVLLIQCRKSSDGCGGRALAGVVDDEARGGLVQLGTGSRRLRAMLPPGFEQQQWRTGAADRD